MDFISRFNEEASNLIWGPAVLETDDPYPALSSNLCPSLWVHHWNPDPFCNSGPDWSVGHMQPIIPESQNEESPLPPGFSLLTKFKSLLGVHHPVASAGGWKKFLCASDSERMVAADTIRICLAGSDWVGDEEFPVFQDIVEIESVYLVYRRDGEIFRAEVPPTEAWGSILEFAGNPVKSDNLPSFDKTISLAWVATQSKPLGDSLPEELKSWAIDETARVFSSGWTDVNGRMRQLEATGQIERASNISWIFPSEMIMQEIRRFMPTGALTEYAKNVARFVPDEEVTELEKFFGVTIREKVKVAPITQLEVKDPVYWVYASGEQEGPYSDADMRRLLMEMKIHDQTKVWREDQSDWKTFADFPELAIRESHTEKPKPQPKPAKREEVIKPAVWIAFGKERRKMLHHQIVDLLKIDPNFRRCLAWDETAQRWLSVQEMFIHECIRAALDNPNYTQPRTLMSDDPAPSIRIAVLPANQIGYNPIEKLKWEIQSRKNNR